MNTKKKSIEFNSQRNKLIGLHSSWKTSKILLRSFLTFISYIKNPSRFFTIIKMLLFQIGSEQKVKKKIDFQYDSNSIDFLISSNKSLIRFGDGEVFHYLDSDIKAFRKGQAQQKKHTNLTNELKEIILDYSPSSGYALAVNATLLQMSDLDNLKTGLYSLHYQQRYFFKKFLINKSGVTFLDSMLFRPESNLPNSIIEKLWLNKNVILIHNNSYVFKLFQKKYPSFTMFFIKVPKIDAYRRIEQTMKKIHSVVEKNDKEKLIVLVSAGVAAKAIVYRLSKENIVSYDTGHYFEWKFVNKTFLKF